MKFNPFQFLLEPGKNPNARTLRTSFWGKLGDAFRVLTGFIAMNTVDEEKSNSFLTLLSIINDTIKHNPNRTIGLYDYLTLGIFWGLEEVLIKALGKLREWEIGQQIEIIHYQHMAVRLKIATYWYDSIVTKILSLITSITAVFIQATLFFNVALRYLVSAALTVMATPVIGVVSLISSAYSWMFNIKKTAFSVKSTTDTYHSLKEYHEYLEEQIDLPTLKTTLIHRDDITTILIDSNIKMDVESVYALLANKPLIAPTCIITKWEHKHVDSNGYYIGKDVPLWITTPEDVLKRGARYCYVMNLDESRDSGTLYYLEAEIVEPVYKITMNSSKRDFLTYCNSIRERSIIRSMLNPKQINEWITSTKFAHAPNTNTYQRFIYGCTNTDEPQLSMVIEESDTAFYMYRSFTPYNHDSSARIEAPTIVCEKSITYPSPQYEELSALLPKHHTHRTMRLNIEAVPPGNNFGYNEKLRFFGTVERKEQLDNLAILNFAGIGEMEEEDLQFSK